MNVKIEFSARDVTLLLESERLKTFKDWPNDLNWACTPQKLAAAGFYFNPSSESPDNVCCIFCQKELDGWEPDDVPAKEHKKHSPACPYLNLRKPTEKLTLVEFLRINSKVALVKIDKAIDRKRREFEEQGIVVRETIVQHIRGK